ncbi:hypothetical protein A1Q_1402 [Vibrio campbellii HY01]|nr:hypothetical protein A1Q_1402 [Vibrio campbellii HY01]
MIVWSVANQKGGVGKTTSTVTLAGLLSQKVIVFDGGYRSTRVADDLSWL